MSDHRKRQRFTESVARVLFTHAPFTRMLFTGAPFTRTLFTRAPFTGAVAFTLLAALGCLSTPAGAQVAVKNQGYIPFSDAPINYRSNDLNDPVSQLQQKLDQGKATLVYEPEHGYLRSVLQLLQVPIDSQTLVFSKTSFQYPKISPEHPRALYFNDDIYVGSVHEGKAIEIVSFDPRQGAIFYLLDERKVEKPAFQRAELDCTQCHIAAGTRGIPGVLLRSVYPTTTGTLVPGTRALITDQESPWSERWGGWYVTGDLAGGTSRGNAVVEDNPSTPASDAAAPSATSTPTSVAGSAPSAASTTPRSVAASAPSAATKLTSLGKPFDSSAYLSPDSDVVAHLVLAHQTQMHNLITLTNYKTRLALYSQADHSGNAAPSTNAPPFANGAPSENGVPSAHAAPSANAAPSADAPPSTNAAPAEATLPEATRRQFERPAEQLLRYLLFANEAPLPGSSSKQRVGASSSFAKEFAARGPRDSKGRSLRDLDLTTRIFRYPCSYLVYSDSFAALPEPARTYVYHRLLEVLSGQDQSQDFARLTAADRQAVLEILLDTQHGLPQEWTDYAAAHHLRVAQQPDLSNHRG
jgi:hypothetical protein